MLRLLIITMLVLGGCSAVDLGYDLQFPSQSIKLGKKLNEISGIQILNDTTAVAVQDEKAEIFTIDLRSGDIIDRVDFGKDADFEGIAQVGDSLYILKSNGTIYRFDGQDSEKSEFDHSKDFDFEGLCFEPSRNVLLVACKDHGKKKKRDHIYIYAFSPSKMKYEEDPLFKIDKEKIHENFMPSGIAVHPNGEIYIISSHSKSMIVLSQKGKLLRNGQLSEYIFHQPEGIGFNLDGDLYICNEKHKTYPTLLKFNSTNAPD
jgi:uncharacterized protein YjiK